MGVFATRSGFRPNAIGISAVALEGIGRQKGKLVLELSGIDLLDRTPVLDIKPYLPYADMIPEATGGFARQRPGASIIAIESSHLRLRRNAPGWNDV
jgi:tRNA (Thr-GGU) A37 N-methylase